MPKASTSTPSFKLHIEVLGAGFSPLTPTERPAHQTRFHTPIEAIHREEDRDALPAHETYHFRNPDPRSIKLRIPLNVVAR